MSNLQDRIPSKIVEQGEHEGITWCVTQGPYSNYYPNVQYKQHNGYCVIPEDHPLSGIPDDNYDAYDDLEVHGGITYCSENVIGFDTVHLGDYFPWGDFPTNHPARKWSFEAVKQETLKLAQQIKDYPTQTPES